MRNSFLAFFAFILFSFPCTAQIWKWSAAMGSNDNVSFDGFRVVRTDNAGNVYAVGRMFDTVSVNNNIVSVYSGGETYVAKFDSTGNLLWLRQPYHLQPSHYSNHGIMEVYDMIIDSTGHLYLTGWYAGQTLPFGPDTITSTYQSDIFLLKCDTALNPIWIRTNKNIAIPQINSENGQSLAFDPSGRICVAGNYNNTTVIGQDTLRSYSTSRADIFLAVYDTNGNCAWAKNMKAKFDSYGTGVSTDAQGNIYLSGRHYGYITCQGDSIFEPNGYWYHVVAKFNGSGQLKWMKDIAKNFGGTWSNDLAVSGNKIYSAGELGGSVTYNSITHTPNGASDLYITRLDTSGNVEWFMNSNFPGIDQAEHIELGSGDNIYIAGHFTKPISWCVDSIFPVAYQYNQQWIDHFVVKADSSGNLQWIVPTGSPQNDYYISNVHVDENDHVYTCGIFNGLTLFDTITYTPNGPADGYVAALRQAPCCFKNLNVPFNNVMCYGDSLLLDAGPGYVSYLWSTGETTQTIYAHNEGLYQVLRTDNTQCLVSSPTVFIDVKPDAILNYSSYNCAGDTVQINVGPGPYTNYLWSDGEITSSAHVTQNGFYFVTVTDTNNCTGPSNTAAIVFDSIPPVPTITVNGNTFTSSSPVNNQWLLNGNPINGATNQNYTFTQSGSYSVIVSNFCGSDTSAIIVVSGENSQADNPEISIFPNPSSTGVTVQCNGLDGKMIRVSIYDAQGRMLQEENVEKENLEKGYRLEFSFTNPGAYFLQIGDSRKLLIKE